MTDNEQSTTCHSTTALRRGAASGVQHDFSIQGLSALHGGLATRKGWPRERRAPERVDHGLAPSKRVANDDPPRPTANDLLLERRRRQDRCPGGQRAVHDSRVAAEEVRR